VAALTQSQHVRSVRWAPAWIAAITLVSLMWPAPPAIANELQPVPGSPLAAALGIKDLGDRNHQLDNYMGQVILVNFWATWCPPCVAEMPSLQRLKTALSGQPFTVLAVNMGEGKLRVRHFKNTSGLDFPFLLDSASGASKNWGVRFLPTSFLIDAQGRLRYKAYGEVAWDDAAVRAIITQLVKEAGNANGSRESLLVPPK